MSATIVKAAGTTTRDGDKGLEGRQWRRGNERLARTSYRPQYAALPSRAPLIYRPPAWRASKLSSSEGNLVSDADADISDNAAAQSASCPSTGATTRLARARCSEHSCAKKSTNTRTDGRSPRREGKTA